MYLSSMNYEIVDDRVSNICQAIVEIFAYKYIKLAKIVQLLSTPSKFYEIVFSIEGKQVCCIHTNNKLSTHFFIHNITKLFFHNFSLEFLLELHIHK